MSALSRTRGYGVLGAAAIVFAVSILFSVALMLSHQRTQDDNPFTSVAWIVSQAEVETYLFLNDVRAFAENDRSISRGDLARRLQVLRDQFDALRGNLATETVRSAPDFAAAAETTTNGIDRLDVALAALPEHDQAAIARLKDQATRLAQSLHMLSAQALEIDKAAAAIRRHRAQQVYTELIGFFIGALVSGGILVFLLFRGIRRAQRLLDDRQAADERLRDSEQRFRDFAASASDWLWDTDARLRFTYFSESYLERIGLPSATTLGKTFDEIAQLDSAGQAGLNSRRYWPADSHSARFASRFRRAMACPGRSR